MSKRYTVEAPDGSELHVVASLEGYDDWTVLLEEDGASPADLGEDDEFDPARGWQKSSAREKARKRRAVANDPEALLARIEQLEQQLAQLETKKETKS